jgi:hypothetical protein
VLAELKEWLFVAAGGTGEQMIVVLDGTRDAPDVVQRWPAGQRQPWLRLSCPFVVL